MIVITLMVMGVQIVKLIWTISVQEQEQQKLHLMFVQNNVGLEKFLSNRDLELDQLFLRKNAIWARIPYRVVFILVVKLIVQLLKDGHVQHQEQILILFQHVFQLAEIH